VLTLASLRWVLRHRAYTPHYLLRYWRFFRFKLTHPNVITTGFVFLGKRVEVLARPGYGRVVLGRWVHLGDGTSLRCHEGTLRVGDKTVFGRNIVVNAYLDVEIGAACILADLVYLTDFDHEFSDLTVPIKDQGINSSPVRIGSDVWLGTKVTVVRGTTVGDGAVVAANAVVTRDVPDYAIAAGVPARVIRDRRQASIEAEVTRAALADMASKLQAAVPDSAGTKAQSAGTKAQSAGTKAQSAGTKAQSAGTKAQSASTKAQSASTKAQLAGTAARSVGTTGKSAGRMAESVAKKAESVAKEAESTGRPAPPDRPPRSAEPPRPS
jgi:acetyltransferase-like isoleucine patch superfamily enzyme